MAVEQKVRELQHFINGALVAGTSGRFSNVFNPSTGEVIARVPLATKDEVKDAIEKAKAAFPAWKKTSAGKRAEIVQRFRQLVTENIDELIEVICEESGKTKEDAKGEITRGLESVDLAINAAHMTKGEYSVNVGGGINAFSAKYPLGVVAAIAPFNFPVMVPLAQTSMAVAVGNSVILKPSEKVPVSALYISNLWKEAGLPDGVWTVINGDKEAVDELLENKTIEAISFVGSTPVAEYIYQTGTNYNKRVAAFGGGKNFMVVMPDADLEKTANAFLGAAYGAASQRCMAISGAIPVGKETADKFVAILKEKIENLKVGPYTDAEVDFGPVITQQSKDVVIAAINKGIEEGAQIVVDGRNPKISETSKGFYVGPTLLDYVTPSMEIYENEVFGPARIIVRTESLQEAIDLINDHELGNGVTIFTNNGAAARKFQEEIEVGMVGVNVPIPIPVGYHNFGGLKRSKFGEGYMFGPDQARFFTKVKTISERWLEADDETTSSFSFPSNDSAK
ncbi:malonate-semialdehyde dehydrogenase (acetylating)/methylmalonate-semialdehyde dehydrogenase [Lysinibacillus composti]|uniref:methylmalonate-semialdehyde dehydrogenase (CoA acylating) n=1 Tax=Lysinibacillus composti TaxID=720633 RepID=A0A3N9UAJ1_9BACI|nr:CoA-acylating methylmalonate-semialdehyde dehydrogenase [Lysinibacillus composti]MBM7609858.1 malonate-semialdehyde dehydrogenase (acetylating)/methylmalonate-semialdehyde dehydrogenase [Lysinibacillus composti]RQW73534.1 CoA-acylating methylmalonate-semialdehyde dehydrogenase [Lysinibacillus composti]